MNGYPRISNFLNLQLVFKVSDTRSNFINSDRKRIGQIILLIKNVRKQLYFLPVFCLIMWVMKDSKNFGKIDILKVWEQIFIGGGKTHFGKLAMKWGMKKIPFSKYYVIIFEPIMIQVHKVTPNDRLNFSLVKDSFVVAWKLTRNGHKMAIYVL